MSGPLPYFTYLAMVRYANTEPAYAADPDGIVWTKNKAEAHRFKGGVKAMKLAKKQAKATKGTAHLSY